MKYLIPFLITILFPACGGIQRADVMHVQEATATCDAYADLDINGFDLKVSIAPKCSLEAQDACELEVCVDVLGLHMCKLVTQ